jgi:DNA-binding NarL/FixJ family response regulator
MFELPATYLAVEEASCDIRVVVADDHPIVRSGIKNELLHYPDVAVLGEAADGDQVLQQVKALQPDVLLLDINMPGLRAIQLVRQLQTLPTPPKILVLTAYGDVELVVALLKAGAKGYLLKDDDPAVIIEGVRTVAQGKTYLSRALATSVVEYLVKDKPKRPEPELSPREMEVLQLVAQGWGNAQIAQVLDISEGTVKNHVTSLYSKISVRSRAELVVWAWQHKPPDIVETR